MKLKNHVALYQILLGIKLAYLSVGRDKAFTDFTWEITNMSKRKFRSLLFELLRFIAVFLLAAVSWVLR